MLRKKQHKVCKGNSKKIDELKWLKTKHLKRMLLRNRNICIYIVFDYQFIFYFNIYFNILTTC